MKDSSNTINSLRGHGREKYKSDKRIYRESIKDR